MSHPSRCSRRKSFPTLALDTSIRKVFQEARCAHQVTALPCNHGMCRTCTGQAHLIATGRKLCHTQQPSRSHRSVLWVPRDLIPCPHMLHLLHLLLHLLNNNNRSTIDFGASSPAVQNSGRRHSPKGNRSTFSFGQSVHAILLLMYLSQEVFVITQHNLFCMYAWRSQG